jgi:hypothetical protein
MSRRNDIDRAIGNLMKWSSRPEWAERRQAVYDEHLCGAAARCDLAVAGLLEDLHETGHFPMVMGLAFEDFASRPATETAPNVVDDYLKRRGWRESPSGRRYLTQRNSVLSLYEVLDVDRGRSVVVRDLLRGGGRTRVHEKLGTEHLVRWDRLAARVVEMGGRPVFTGGLMHFGPEPADAVLALLDATSPPDFVDAFVRERCASFTEVWLVDFVSRREVPLPNLVNREGEALLFGEVRFPVEQAHRSGIEAALDAADGWVRRPTDGPTWTWLDEAPPSSSPGRGLSIRSETEDGQPILGTAELRDNALMFTANSRERTERGTGALESLLERRIGRPTTSYQAPEAMRARGDDAIDEEPAGSEVLELDEETKRLAIAQVKDNHYRRVLDEPVPALGGKSPRACARSKRHRHEVVAWLKHLENLELRAAARQGPGAYDVGWIWEELGLGEFRS